MTTMTQDDRPLYVRRLDAERRQAQAELESLREGLNELRAYLNSPKFRSADAGDRHNLVNVDDVLLRLNETSYAALLAGEAATR